MNRHDSDVLAGELARLGHIPANSIQAADVVIFNTCAVRGHAEDKLYSHLGAMRRECAKNPRLRVGVMGCVAQKDGEILIQRFPHISFVLGTQQMDRLGEIVDSLEDTEDIRIADTDVPEHPHPLRIPSHIAALSSPWSAQVTVMRGCNNFCSYCVVPYVQGREISRPMDDILEDVRRLADRGVTDIMLLGQNVDSYGKTLEGHPCLSQLIEKLAGIHRLKRISFVTNHPKDMSMQLVETVASIDIAAPYFHIPPQAGNNRILKLMNRRYTREHYIQLVTQIRERIPDAAIAGDFIVGFPTETDEEFQDTLDLVEQVHLASAFIFKYSPRPMTHAAQMEDDVPVSEKARRHAALTEIQHRISLEENQKLAGEMQEVLIQGQSQRDPNRLTGRTPGNRIVIMPSGTGQPGEFVHVKIVAGTALSLYAEGVKPVVSDENETEDAISE